MLKKTLGLVVAFALIGAATLATSRPAAALSGRVCSGGSGGGGGSTKPLEIRVTGYITAVDYDHGTIQVGASYYGSGLMTVTTNTKISLDNINCDFNSLQVGDWCEARYDYYTRTANKLACLSL